MLQLSDMERFKKLLEKYPLTQFYSKWVITDVITKSVLNFDISKR